MKRLLLTILFVFATCSMSFADFGGFLKANTEVIVTIGPFVDVGDGFTPETGITLGAADEAELIKHGSTSVVDISGATWAAVTNCDGSYSLTLTTSHTDTEGQLRVAIQDDSVCLPKTTTFEVQSEAAYNSMFGADDDGTGYMRTDAYEVNDQSQTANDNSADINDILIDTGTTLDTLIKRLRK